MKTQQSTAERLGSSWEIWGKALRFYSEHIYQLLPAFPLLFIPFFTDCFLSEIIRHERDNDGNLDISSAATTSAGCAWSHLSMRVRFLIPSILWAYIPVYGWYRDLEHRVDMALVSNVIAFEGLTGTTGIKRCIELRSSTDWKMAVRSLLEIPTLLGLILIGGLAFFLTFASLRGTFAVFVALSLFLVFPMSAAANTFFYLSITERGKRTVITPAEAKPVLNFEDFCPNCVNLDDETGICTRLSENVRAYPKKFLRECGGQYFDGVSD
jgi:hypothetical protein